MELLALGAAGPGPTRGGSKVGVCVHVAPCPQSLSSISLLWFPLCWLHSQEGSSYVVAKRVTSSSSLTNPQTGKTSLQQFHNSTPPQWIFVTLTNQADVTCPRQKQWGHRVLWRHGLRTKQGWLMAQGKATWLIERGRNEMLGGQSQQTPTASQALKTADSFPSAYRMHHWTLNTRCFQRLSPSDLLSQSESFPAALPPVGQATQLPPPASWWGCVAFSYIPTVCRTFLLLRPGYLNTTCTHCWKRMCC